MPKWDLVYNVGGELREGHMKNKYSAKNITTYVSDYPLKVISLILGLLIIVGIALLIFTDIDMKDIVGFIQIIILPLSLGATALSINKSNETHETSIELEKVRLTNEFVMGFREIMDSFSTHSYIKKNYYDQNKKVKEMMKKIDGCSKLEFSYEFIESLLPKTMTYDELNDYITVTKKVENKNLETFVEVCERIYFLDSYSKPNYFHETTKRYLEKKDSLLAEFETEKAMLKDKGSNIRDSLEQLKIKYKSDVRTLKLLYAKSIREADSELMNDMECLLFNVNYDLLNYDQLLHLIIDPFKSYINSFFLDLSFSIINGRKNDRLIFSNIVNFYEIMIDLEADYKEKLEKNRQEKKLISEETNKGYKKSIK